MEEVAIVRAEPMERSGAVRIGKEEREAVHGPEVIPSRVDDLPVGQERGIEVVALVEADALEVRAVRVARVEVLGRAVVVLVHLPVARARERDAAVRRVQRIEVVSPAARDLAQVRAVRVDLVDVVMRGIRQAEGEQDPFPIEGDARIEHGGAREAGQSRDLSVG